MTEMKQFTSLHTVKFQEEIKEDSTLVEQWGVCDLRLMTGAKERWYGDQDHSRWVYGDRVSKRVYKIWNQTYVRRDNLLQALKAGFFDEKLIPHFVGLIFQEGFCRGYVTKMCEEYGTMVPDLFEHIKGKTLDTRFFFYDFCSKHIMMFEGKPCVIDLEAIYPLDQYKAKEEEHDRLGISGKFIEYDEYKNFLDDICG